MALQVERPLAGGPVVGESGSAVNTYPTGRVCSNEGCGTRLSRYNPDDQCALHRCPEGLKYTRWTNG